MLKPNMNGCFPPLVFPNGQVEERFRRQEGLSPPLPCFCHQEKALQFYSELCWRAIILAVQLHHEH